MAVDVQDDKRLDVELLFSDSILVRVLVETVSDELNDDLFAASDQRDDKKTENESLEYVEIGIRGGRRVTDKGVFAVAIQEMVSCAFAAIRRMIVIDLQQRLE